MASHSAFEPDENARSNEYSLEEISEADWMAEAFKSEAFQFLADPIEDIYTLEDGEPYRDIK